MKRVMRNAVILCLLSLLLGLGAGAALGVPDLTLGDEGIVCTGPDPAQPLVQWITQVDAEASLGDSSVRFVDARPREGYQSGHITGALHIPPTSEPLNPEVLQTLRDARVVITYCDTMDGCALSTQLASRLADEGLVDIRVLEGGIDYWIAHGFQAESGSCGACP